MEQKYVSHKQHMDIHDVTQRERIEINRLRNQLLGMKREQAKTEGELHEALEKIKQLEAVIAHDN